jgi:hypothetical protein
MPDNWNNTTSIAVGDLLRWQEKVFDGPSSWGRPIKVRAYTAKVVGGTPETVQLEVISKPWREDNPFKTYRKTAKLFALGVQRLRTQQGRGKVVATNRGGWVVKAIKDAVAHDEYRERQRERRASSLVMPVADATPDSQGGRK